MSGILIKEDIICSPLQLKSNGEGNSMYEESGEWPQPCTTDTKTIFQGQEFT